MSAFSDFNSLPRKHIWEGITARAVNGERLTMALVDLEPDTPLQEHSHPNEQLGFVLQGELTFIVGGESRTLRAGDTYTIPGNVPHSGKTGPQGAVVVDIFAPVRADWDGVVESEPRPSAWRGGA